MMLFDLDPVKSQRVMKAMLPMVRLISKSSKQAYSGK